jgi:C_GCAxxG_C_C family probable redox protein
MLDGVPPSLGLAAQQLLAVSANCAQSCFRVLTQHLNLDAGETAKALTPFPGGIALRGDTCGAVVGSVMAIGLVLGRDRLEDVPAMQPSIAASRRFCRDFEERFGGTACRAVLERGLGESFDLARPEELEAYRDAGGNALCSDVVAHAVESAAMILGDTGS